MLSKGCTLGCRSLIKKTDVCCLVHYSDTCVWLKKRRRRNIWTEEGESLENRLAIICGCDFQTHLQLSDPGAVPVGLSGQLYKELPLCPAFHWWRWWGVGWSIGSGWNRNGRWRLTPSPVEDLLDSSLDWRTLEQKCIFKITSVYLSEKMEICEV